MKTRTASDSRTSSHLSPFGLLYTSLASKVIRPHLGLKTTTPEALKSFPNPTCYVRSSFNTCRIASAGQSSSAEITRTCELSATLTSTCEQDSSFDGAMSNSVVGNHPSVVPKSPGQIRHLVPSLSSTIPAASCRAIRIGLSKPFRSDSAAVIPPFVGIAQACPYRSPSPSRVCLPLSRRKPGSVRLPSSKYR
jgi:hypothetical protein